jgi:3-oxoacyl-[acyl-carrier protein] reductase
MNAGKSLLGKVAIVTGGSRGIGKAIAERLGGAGAAVVVNYCCSEQGAREVVVGIEAAGGRAVAIHADVSKAADVRRLFRETVETFGAVDVVVTNAGAAHWGTLETVSEDDYETVFGINTKGAFLALREAARYIGDGGRIINVGSSATALTIPGLALYAASKAASAQLAKVLAKEVGHRAITVNTISPGYTATDMLPNDPEFRRSAAESAMLGRLGQPHDIADVVAFLASEQGRWITGQNIQAGGGLVS